MLKNKCTHDLFSHVPSVAHWKCNFVYRSSVRLECAFVESVCMHCTCAVYMTMVYREMCIRLCRLLDYLLLSLFLHIRKIGNLVRIIIYGTQILSHAQTYTHTHACAHTMLRFNLTS